MIRFDNEILNGENNKKGVNMFTWIKDRLKERTTFDGILLLVAGASVVFLGPIAKLLAWGMMAYGAWTIWKSE
jgi:hypothetical protein